MSPDQTCHIKWIKYQDFENFRDHFEKNVMLLALWNSLILALSHIYINPKVWDTYLMLDAKYHEAAISTSYENYFPAHPPDQHSPYYHLIFTMWNSSENHWWYEFHVNFIHMKKYLPVQFNSFSLLLNNIQQLYILYNIQLHVLSKNNIRLFLISNYSASMTCWPTLQRILV